MFLSLSLMVLVLFAPSLAFAQTVVGSPAWCNQSEANSQLCATAGTNGAGYGLPADPRVTVAIIVKIILTLGGTVLFLLDIYAGYLWMTAAGNDEQVTKAQTTLRNSTIGLIIVIFAYTITIAVSNLAQGQPLGYGAQQGASLQDLGSRSFWTGN